MTILQLHFSGAALAERMTRLSVDTQPWPPAQTLANGYQQILYFGDITGASLVVPSFCPTATHLLEQRWRFILQHQGRAYALDWFGGGLTPAAPPPIRQQSEQTQQAGKQAGGAESPEVRAMIDCWLVQQDLRDVRIVLQTTHKPLDDSWGALSIRPHTMTPAHAPVITVNTTTVQANAAPVTASDHPDTPAIKTLAISQMQQDSPHRQAICSPCATAMALSASTLGSTVRNADDVKPIVRECYDKRHQIYGIWPHAINCAARRGQMGAVIACRDASLLHRWLNAGIPVVVSLRFTQGALAGAPLAQTDGHLLTVTGYANKQYRVADPAASDASSVVRRYAADQFEQAWLQQRGVGYFFLPAAHH